MSDHGFVVDGPISPIERSNPFPLSDPCLPLDVLHEVIDQLAAGPSPLAYIYEPGVVETLRSLCLVSRNISRRATFHLYARVRLTSEEQLSLLINSSACHHAKIRSLSVNGSSMNDKFLLMGELIGQMRMTLRRLLIEEVSKAAWGSAVRAVAALLINPPDLEELSVTTLGSDVLYLTGPGGLPIEEKCTNLERLTMCFQSPTAHDYALPKLPRVGVLALLVLCDETPAIEKVVESLPSLTRLILILCANNDTEYYGSLPRKQWAARYADRMHIIEVHAPCDCNDLTLWASDAARSGELYSLPGMDWLSLSD